MERVRSRARSSVPIPIIEKVVQIGQYADKSIQNIPRSACLNKIPHGFINSKPRATSHHIYLFFDDCILSWPYLSTSNNSYFKDKYIRCASLWGKTPKNNVLLYQIKTTDQRFYFHNQYANLSSDEFDAKILTLCITEPNMIAYD